MASINKYASSILEYSMKHKMNFRIYRESLEGRRMSRINLTNDWGVPNTLIIAELFLINDKVYYKTNKETESKGLIKCLKEKFPDKVKRMERDF